MDDPFKDAIQFDKKVMKQRAIKTAYATAGTLAVAIPVTVAIYYAVTPFGFLPPDVVGAIGVARTLVYKGTVSAPLYTRRDGKISDGREDKTPSFFQEYCYKLEKLYDRFYTDRGRELALQRRAAAVRFYKNLYEEVTQLDEQGKICLERHLG